MPRHFPDSARNHTKLQKNIAGFGKNCIDRGKNVLYNKSQEQISAKENYA